MYFGDPAGTLDDKKERSLLIAAGLLIGAACFIRDTAGALGFDGAATVQYIRPEIIGFVLGAFLLALFKFFNIFTNS